MNTEWKTVPATMTLDMCVAFAEAWFSKVRCIDDPEMQDAYAAMLAAAPPAPTSHPIPTGATGEDESGNLRFSARRILDAALWWAEQRVVGPTQAKAAWEALEKHTLMQLRAQRSGTDEITARHAVQTLADAIYASAHRMGIKNGDNTALSLGQCLDLLNRMSAPAAGDALKPDFERAEQIASEYVQDYEWRGEDVAGRDTCYTPSKRERAMITDAILGLLAEPEFIAAIAQQKGEA